MHFNEWKNNLLPVICLCMFVSMMIQKQLNGLPQNLEQYVWRKNPFNLDADIAVDLL